jgi:hypothetical protein
VKTEDLIRDPVFQLKADSFSPNSNSSRQARGHLLAAGDAFAEVFAPLRFCLLCYLVPEESRPLMTDCLRELTSDLANAGLKPAPYSTHGLALLNRELVYSWDDAFRNHMGVPETAAVVMSNVEEDTDPSPLFLIYTDEDYPDAQSRDTLRRCLINQVHAQMVCDLNQLPAGEVYERSAESLLIDMTDNLYQYLARKRQKAMRRLVAENVFRRMADFCRERFSEVVNVQGQELIIRFADESSKTAFLEWFEDFHRTAFPVARPPEDTMPLFDHIQNDQSA